MELKKIISACLLIMFLFFIQCKDLDLSPITLDFEGDNMHLKNENIHLTLDEIYVL